MQVVIRHLYESLLVFMIHFAAALIVTGGQDKAILIHSTEQGMQGMFTCVVSTLNMNTVCVLLMPHVAFRSIV